MADDTENTENTDEAPKKKSKLLLILLIGGVIALGGGGFFAYTKFMSPPPVEDEKTIPQAPVQTVGEMFDLEPFVVNLSDPKGKRYLKVKVTIELESLELVEKATKYVPKMRDMVIMMLTSLTFEEVMTPEGKLRVRDELLERFNHTMRPDRINNIYFTEFVIQ